MIEHQKTISVVKECLDKKMVTETDAQEEMKHEPHTNKIVFQKCPSNNVVKSGVRSSSLDDLPFAHRLTCRRSSLRALRSCKELTSKTSAIIGECRKCLISNECVHKKIPTRNELQLDREHGSLSESTLITLDKDLPPKQNSTVESIPKTYSEDTFTRAHHLSSVRLGLRRLKSCKDLPSKRSTMTEVYRDASISRDRSAGSALVKAELQADNELQVDNKYGSLVNPGVVPINQTIVPKHNSAEKSRDKNSSLGELHVVQRSNSLHVGLRRLASFREVTSKKSISGPTLPILTSSSRVTNKSISPEASHNNAKLQKKNMSIPQGGRRKSAISVKSNRSTMESEDSTSNTDWSLSNSMSTSDEKIDVLQENKHKGFKYNECTARISKVTTSRRPSIELLFDQFFDIVGEDPGW